MAGAWPGVRKETSCEEEVANMTVGAHSLVPRPSLPCSSLASHKLTLCPKAFMPIFRVYKSPP